MDEYPEPFVLNDKALDFEEKAKAEFAEEIPGVTKVLRLNKAKFNTFFEEPNRSNIMEFLSKTIVEFRVTIGQNWNNAMFSSKGPYLNKFTKTVFKRGSESHYSRNIIMFNEKLEQLNLRVTFGVCRDFETETHHLK